MKITSEITSEMLLWIEIEEDGTETGYFEDFKEDIALYEVNEIDSWDGRTFKLALNV